MEHERSYAIARVSAEHPFASSTWAMKFGRGQKDSTSISLFQNIVYAFHESVEPAKRTKVHRAA